MANFNHCEQLLDKLNRQREAGFLCDCTIFIGNFQYKAHKNVLASFSEYFRALFKDALDCVVLLDQKQVTPVGFQTMLDFIYSGNLNFDRCNIQEICTAAEYLRLEKIVLTCRTKLDTVSVGKTCVAESPTIGDCPATNTQSISLNIEGTAITKKPEERSSAKKVVNLKVPKSKKWRRTMRAHQKVQENVIETNDPVSLASPNLSLGISDLTETLGGQASQNKDCGLLPHTAVLNCESFLAEDSIPQCALAQRKCVKSQQNGALKEHCSSNIVSESNMCKMEGLVEDIDQTYLKNKPTCNTCAKVFSEASSLRRHMRIHKGVKPYVCHLCGKAFTQCNQLKTHVRTHTGEKPYQCKQCDKGFAQKCQLVFHSRMHHGEEKPYKCDVCNLQFATSSNLKIHSRKHSGEKPYVCERCGQSFAQASTLTYHVRRHTGEKPYVCDTCGKAFAVSSSLITHARKHTGEKPYICGVCGKSFISSGELNKHFRSHTGERPFVCEVCGNSYTDVKNLKKHKLKMHSGIEDPDETGTMEGTHNDEDPTKKSPVLDNLDLKPSELFLPLTLHIGAEDHQMLLPVTDNQCLSSDPLLRTSANSYSEPQFIFLQQMY